VHRRAEQPAMLQQPHALAWPAAVLLHTVIADR
jgi:hypothetical protein